jgi:hypothetical protein
MGDGALLGLAGELIVADLLGFVALETLGSGVGDSVATAELGGGAGGSLVAGVVSVMGLAKATEPRESLLSSPDPLSERS